MVAGYRMVVVVCQGVGEADSLGFASAVGCHVSCPPASRPQPAAAARVQLLLADAALLALSARPGIRRFSVTAEPVDLLSSTVEPWAP
eukprot:COSAG01_NODE_2687_length_7249_cov_105.374406_3_plen_88_part_00